MEWVLLMSIGLVAGTIGSLIGLGGGVIIVPAILYFGSMAMLLDLSPQQAVGTSLIIMIFTGLSSTLAYMKYKTVDYKSGWIFFIGSGPGGIAGAYVNRILNMESFQVYFGIFMIITALILMFRSKVKPLPAAGKGGIQRIFTEKNGQQLTYSFQPSQAILIAFLIGFLSGIFGIGGGSLLVPAMILLFAFPPHVAVATSMFIIFLSAIISSLTHVAFGHVVWLYALALIPGAWIGAKAGAYLNTKLKSKALVSLLRIILIIIGIRLIYQGLA
ncbi:putative membrane protein YfcA [Bacillus ectoiniformans]|uniref:TSUP family transporter n=1 Tax=Bacillus ectoiniformans TaxID=1494429 RepID=UPI00195C4792|nr:putative membrane protein YfcA [Bacillus ectoiniformans]